MPTYRARQTAPLTNIDGNMVVVNAGNTIESYELSPAGFDLVSALPYYNPCAEVHEISSSGESDIKTIALHGRTDEVEIYNESDAEITVFLQSIDNAPGTKVFANSVRTISKLKGWVNALILQFSQAGACTLTEIKG